MNDLEIKMEKLIYEVRGKYVMLDSDLARIYHCKNGTKEINQAVKRNINRFPKEFCFQLTEKEYTNLKSQFVTSKSNGHGGVRKLPFVFTELDIINSAKKSIIIIDNYLLKGLLDLFSNTNKSIIVYSKNIDNDLINKYNSQYHNVTFKVDNRFHDRFIIVDKRIIYHSGASFKDLGKKCFAINKTVDKEIIDNLLSRL